MSSARTTITLASAPKDRTMQQARRSLVLAAALAATAFSAAQDGDIGAGYALARETCRACHMVEAEETLATGTRT